MDTILLYLEGSFGLALTTLAGLTAIVSLQVWLPLRAWRDKWWWGLVALIPAVGSVFYALVSWRKARTPIAIGIVALVFAMLLFDARTLSGGPSVLGPE